MDPTITSSNFQTVIQNSLQGNSKLICEEIGRKRKAMDDEAAPVTVGFARSDTGICSDNGIGYR